MRLFVSSDGSIGIGIVLSIFSRHRTASPRWFDGIGRVGWDGMDTWVGRYLGRRDVFYYSFVR